METSTLNQLIGGLCTIIGATISAWAIIRSSKSDQAAQSQSGDAVSTPCPKNTSDDTATSDPVNRGYDGVREIVADLFRPDWSLIGVPLIAIGMVPDITSNDPITRVTILVIAGKCTLLGMAIISYLFGKILSFSTRLLWRYKR